MFSTFLWIHNWWSVWQSQTFIVGSHDEKLGNMLMSPKNDNGSTKKNRKGDSVEDSEEQTAKLLNEDPLDWMLKNEHVGNMLSVSEEKLRELKTLQMFFELFKILFQPDHLGCNNNFPYMTHLRFRMCAIMSYLINWSRWYKTWITRRVMLTASCCCYARWNRWFGVCRRQSARESWATPNNETSETRKIPIAWMSSSSLFHRSRSSKTMDLNARKVTKAANYFKTATTFMIAYAKLIRVIPFFKHVTSK